jgi:TM2 domain-containing membrane protein YozV
MKTRRLILLLVVGLLVTNVSSFAFVVAPQSAAAATGYERTTAAGLNAKEIKKQTKKEVRAKKKAERRARFLAWIQKKMAGDQQLVAILLALFLGGLGIHRVYLGSEPIIILWYLISFFGFFGIIPLIDLIRLLIGQVSHYEGNSNLFRAFQSS